MVVQHILCSRMGKREVKPVVPAPPKTETSPEKNANPDKEESTDNKDAAVSDNPDKEEGAISETAEKEIKTEDTVEDEEKNEAHDTKEDTKKQEESADSKPVETTAVVDVKPQMIEVEEYFVKYRNFSYLHCEWRTEEELYKGDKRIQAKLKRFKQKQQQNTNIFENVFDVHYSQIYRYNVLMIITLLKVCARG